MTSLNLYKRRANHILYVADYMFRMKASNAGVFGLVIFIGNIEWSVNVPGKHESDAK
jgi:hypothetical protein